jgi:hypothetical protein
MFGFVTTFFHGVSTVLMLAMVGAFVGLGCAVVTRVVNGVTAFGVAAAAGALMMIGANYAGVLSQLSSDESKAQIAQLQADKEKLEHDAAAMSEVRDAENVLAEEQSKRLEDAEAQLTKINEVIDSHKADNDNCAVGAFGDELDAIRGLK